MYLEQGGPELAGGGLGTTGLVLMTVAHVQDYIGMRGRRWCEGGEGDPANNGQLG